MSELIFVLIVLYVAYVIKQSCGEKKQTGIDLLVSEDTVSETEESAPSKEVEKPAPVVEEEPVSEKPEPEPEPEKTLSDGKKIPSGSLRNPDTGEDAKMANSYRMSKRWIKDALVTEGFLDKVYKTSEIDDAKKIEINLAFEKLLQLDKYK